MYFLTYRIITRSPIIISAISGDRNIVRTEQYIPGTAVLGLLANRIIKKRAPGSNNVHLDENFYAWFLRGNLKIGNAYIMSRDEYGEYRHFPTPFSIEKEKYGTAVYDSLFCETDDTKYIGDYCVLEEDSIQVQLVETRIEFHHARNRETGTSKKGLIFNYESLLPGQIFEGEIRGDRNNLERLLQYTGNQWTAFLGRSRNAQYGMVEFQFVKEEPIKIATGISIDEKDRSSITISMTLRSDLILHNESGFSTVDVDDLEKELQNRLGKVRIEKAFVKKNEVENFVSVWRLKKPSESCFKAGSVFLLRLPSNNIDKLETLQKSGLGERTHEGFGSVVFGLQTKSQLTLLDETKERIGKPEFQIPQTTRDIIKTIIQNLLCEGIKLQAANKQNEFVRLPSNSLITRLYFLADKYKGNQESFREEVRKFRKIAAEQMQKCLSRDYNLMEFLKQKNPIEEFLCQPREESIEALCQEINYLYKSDNNLKQKLYHNYYTTFFSMMRKRKIAEEKANART